MVVEVSATLVIAGEQFSPEQAERHLGLSFTYKSTSGDGPGTTATLVVQSSPDSPSLLPLDCALFRQGDLVNVLRACGATDFELRLDIRYRGGCNFELPPNLLSALSRLDTKIAVSCNEVPAYLD